MFLIVKFIINNVPIPPPHNATTDSCVKRHTLRGAQASRAVLSGASRYLPPSSYTQ